MNHVAELRLRTSKGDLLARQELVQWLVTSDSLAEREEAMRILLSACDRDDADALLLHAALAARGVGRKQNFEDAVALVAKAAALGDERARGQFAVLGGKFDRELWFRPMQLRQHHEAPRIFTVESFIPPHICAWFVEYAKTQTLQPSTVRDGASGVDIISRGRSATGVGAGALAPDLVIQLTNLRIAGAVQVHVAHQEPTTILHYAPGQEYQAHYDLIRPQEEAAAAEELRVLGQRAATVLVYLNDGYEGGETYFPHLDWGFKGKPGDALIFWNMSAAGERERLSLHAGLPVTRGEKWLLSKWVRQKPVPLI
ncbi:MAG: 2OG-Fe(II) oxygenase [Hyphomonadaceae bacterium]|nr:2OG-Fe(II) oxygenase [Hyphomonadaceae bacterium]